MCTFVWKRSKYRLFISRWGIAVDLEAGYRTLFVAEIEDTYIKIDNAVYFSSALLPYPESVALTVEELDCFCKGLKLVSARINEAADHQPCLIVLRSIQFSDCGIQNDAFTVCALQWASEAFGFPMPAVSVYFDRDAKPYGKYVFDLSHI